VRRRAFSNSQIARRYNSARIYARRVSSYSGCTRAAVQTAGENGGTNVWELTMYGVCALSETQIATRMQRRRDPRTCQTCSSGPRARARRRTISRIAQLEAQKFNRILISPFVRHRSVLRECQREARRFRRKISPRCDNRNCLVSWQFLCTRDVVLGEREQFMRTNAF